MSTEKVNNVMGDLLQIGQLGKRVVSGLVSEAKTRVEEFSKSAQTQVVSGATSTAQKLTNIVQNVSDEITRHSLLRKYNSLISGGMTSGEAMEFIAKKVKEQLEKNKQ